MSTSGGGTLTLHTTTITPAQILTLFTVKVPVVPALGAGVVAFPVAGMVQFNYASTAYVGVNNPALIPDLDPQLDITSATYGLFCLDNAFCEYGQDAIAALVPPRTNQNNSSLFASLAANRPLIFWDPNIGQNPTLTGTITTSTLNAGGSGYAIGDTGTINGSQSPGTAPATYVINTVGLITGDVLTYTITNHDPGYVVANAVATTNTAPQAGIGTGFKINITAIPAADSTIVVTSLYHAITLA